MIERGARLLRSHWTVAALVFALLAIVHTWPLATEPGTLSRNDNGDAQLNEWILAWVAHQLPRHPLQLFQGNIFYPAKDVLAFSEPLIIPALMVAPALWLGASPVLAMNLAMLIGFALTALGTYALVFSWTRDRFSALTAGSLFAFNAHTLTRLPHVQAMHAYGMPLSLLLADRLIGQPSPVTAVLLGACMAMMAYTSGYFVVFATVMIAVVLIVRISDWIRRSLRVAAMFGLAAITAAVLALPLLIPYRRVAVEQHMVRPLAEAGRYSATFIGYLAAPGRAHFETWSSAFFANPVDSFFPGAIAVLLSLVAIWSAIRRRNEPARVAMIFAIGLIGFLLSLGPKAPLYGWLYTVFPPMQGLRAAARFGGLFLLAIAVLAGMGLAHLRQGSHLRQGYGGQAGLGQDPDRRPQNRRWAIAIGVVAVFLVNLEALRAPFEYRRWRGIPEIYRLLAREPGKVVLAEMPFYPPHAVFENAEYVVNSTAHWRPLMNGYSGYTPATYVDAASLMWYFPDARAFPPMNANGVTHIMVHPHRWGHESSRIIERIARQPDLELVAVDEKTGIRLYRYRPQP
jgi:hypothetical protein